MIKEKENLSKLIKESNFEKYLFPFLSPTSKGTQYWESQPPGELTDRQIGRICLQVHQLVEKIKKSQNCNIKSFLDIGTGNGFIPRLLPFFSDLDMSHGCDPFLDGEHKTSFQKHNRDKEFERVLDFLKNISNKDNILYFESYSKNASNEHFYNKPLPIELNFDKKNYKSFEFHQLGAHDLDKLKIRYEYLYCKAIEHIHDWPTIFEKAYRASADKAVFYLKHKSFFSYLGAHRYGSTGLPWGHLRMTNEQYKLYVDKVFPERSKIMKTFFFDGLSYPRNTIGELIRIASTKGWKLGSVEYEKSKHIESFQNLLFDEKLNIYEEIKENFDVSIEELLSGLIHITFTK